MGYGGFCRRLIGIALGCATLGVLANCAVQPSQLDQRNISRADERCPDDEALLPANDTDYGRSLVQQVGKLAFYPKSALSLDQSGVVQICVEINRGGDVQKALVKTSSGYMILNGAALYAVGRANTLSRLEPVPTEFGNGAASVWFTVPVTFAIADEAAPPSPPARSAGAPELNCHDNRPQKKDRAWEATSDAQHYFSALTKAIQQQMLFPPETYERREEGTAHVCMLLARDGRIVEAKISRSAGNPLFDGVALIAVGVAAARSDAPRLPEALPGVPEFFIASVPVTWEYPAGYRGH